MSDTRGMLQAAPPISSTVLPCDNPENNLSEKTEQNFGSKYFESKFTEITKAPKQLNGGGQSLNLKVFGIAALILRNVLL